MVIHLAVLLTRTPQLLIHEYTDARMHSPTHPPVALTHHQLKVMIVASQPAACSFQMSAHAKLCCLCFQTLCLLACKPAF